MPRHARISAVSAAAASRRHGTRGVGGSTRRWCSSAGVPGGPTSTPATTATTTSPPPPVPPPRSAASAAGNTAPEEEAALSPLERALRAADRAEQLAASHTQAGPAQRQSAADTWASTTTTTEAAAAEVAPAPLPPQAAEGAAAAEYGVVPVAAGGSIVGRRAAEKAEVARVEKERAMQALTGQRAEQVAAWYKESRKTPEGMLATVVRTRVGASGPEYLEAVEKSWVESKAWDLYNVFMLVAILGVALKLRYYEGSNFRYFHEILGRQRQDIIWEHMVFDEGTREKNILSDYGWYFKWKERVYFRQRDDRLQEVSGAHQQRGTTDPYLPFWNRVKMESAVTRNWVQNLFGSGF